MARMTTGEERLFTGRAGNLLVILSVGWAVYRIGMMALSPLLPDIIAGLAITPFQAGLALSLSWALNALGQFPSGRLSDQLSRKTLLVTGLSVLAAGFGLIGVAGGYPGFLLGVGLVGVGAGLFPTPARALITDLFEERRGQAYGIHTASGDLGAAIAAVVAVAALALGSWRLAFLPGVVVLPMVVVLLYHRSDEPFVVTRVGFEAAATVRRLFGQSTMRRLLFAFSLYGFTWMGATSFLPTYLQAEKGFSPALASAAFASLFVIGTVAKPVGGHLGDEYGHVPVTVASFAVSATGLGVVVAGTDVPTIAIGVALFSAGLLAIPPLLLVVLMDIFPDTSRGGDLGATRSVWLGVGSLGPTFVGFVAEQLSYGVAFAGLVGFLLVSGGVVVLATRGH